MKEARKARVRSSLVAGICSALLAAGSMTAIAARAHVHGEGELSIAIEAGRVDLALIVPEADLKSGGEESQEALAAMLTDADPFVFEGASCQLVGSSIGYADDEFTDWSDPGEEHDQHHGHDEGDHAYTGEDGHDAHADRLLTWTYRCAADPVRLRVQLFGVTRLELIRVQAIGESGAASAEATADSPEFSLP